MTIIPNNVFQEWVKNNTLVDHISDVQPIIDTEKNIVYTKGWTNYHDRSPGFVITTPLTIDNLKYD